MLTLQEKNKIKDVLGDGLGINRDINLAFFLNKIEETSEATEEMKTQINQILRNQQILDQKLDRIINLINGR
jgi:hypothetical protein